MRISDVSSDVCSSYLPARRCLYREAAGFRAADPEPFARTRASARAGRGGSAEMERAAFYAERANSGGHGGVQGTCDLRLLARRGSEDRKDGGEGKRWSVRVVIVGCWPNKKKKK